MHNLYLHIKKTLTLDNFLITQNLYEKRNQNLIFLPFYYSKRYARFYLYRERSTYDRMNILNQFVS